MKAYIVKDTGKKGALWLVVQRQGLLPDVKSIMGMLRIEHPEDTVVYPILEDEVEAIMQACADYIKTNHENK